MQTFIEGLPEMDKLAFVLNTYGYISAKTLDMLDRFAKDRGFRVVASHSLHTPENFPPMIAKGKGNEQAPDPKEMEAFLAFVAALDEIGRRFGEGQEIPRHKECAGIFAIMPEFSLTWSRNDMGDKYVDEEICTECGTCAKRCPYQAITLSPKPVFDMERCYGCWACYHHCAKKAIYTRKFRGVGHRPRPIPELAEKLRVDG